MTMKTMVMRMEREFCCSAAATMCISWLLEAKSSSPKANQSLPRHQGWGPMGG
jgi:hypothetical protein